jgi:hypothetical protein
MMTSVISDGQREALLAEAKEMEQRAAEIRSRVAWSVESEHSKSAAEVIEMLRDPSMAEQFVDRARELLNQTAFDEVEDCVWSFVNGLITRPNELQGIDSDEVYAVVRRVIRKATQGWEE